MAQYNIQYDLYVFEEEKGMAQTDPVTVLLQQAERTPNTPWLHQPIGATWQTYTWGQAALEVRRLAAGLRGMGFAPGSSILIAGINSAHWVLADLAISMAGYVPVGLYPRQQPEAVRQIGLHCQAQAAIVGVLPNPSGWLEALPACTIAMPYAGVLPCQKRWQEVCAAPLTEYQPPAPDALWSLVYTSGTTSHAKGVEITLANVLFAITGLLEAMPPQKRERLFSYLPFAHLLERGVVAWGGLYMAAEIYFLQSADTFAQDLAKAQPTRFFGVPLVFERMQRAVRAKIPERLLRLPLIGTVLRRAVRKRLGLNACKLCFVGAAAISPGTLAWFRGLGIDLLQAYGMSESTAYATCNLPNANRLGSVGRAMPRSEIKISPEGEILLRHGAVFAGYHRDPDLTAASFDAQGFFCTGDLGYLEDGFLFVTGRKKDLFKTQKGEYVAPVPIENALLESGLFEHLCLVGAGLAQPIMLGCLSAEALVQPRGTLEPQLLAALEAVNATLESHAKIGAILVVRQTWSAENGFLTPTLKLRRQQLETHYAAQVSQLGQSRERLGWEA
jgi:long-chain acyl-CoA synthetase